jgi:hypothetical protein
VNRQFAPSWEPLTTIATGRFTLVDGTVLNTECEVLGLNTPFGSIVKSASSNSRSCADLSMPVVSWTPRGVAKPSSVTSFLMSTRFVPVASATVSVVHASPVLFATGHTLSSKTRLTPSSSETAGV